MVRITKAPDERRNELINMARQLFFSKGYEKTSVSDIVKAVGVAKGTFYHYFDSKTAVLEALIDQIMDGSLTLLEPIVADDSLSAIEKWQRAFAVIGNWKTAQKAEMLALLRLMMREENIPLLFRLQREITKQTAVPLAKIIAQGVAEGVFTTEFIQESAKMVLSLNIGIRDALIPLFLTPEQFDNPLELAWHKYLAVQTAMERILAAPEGSLPLLDKETLAAWFEAEPEPTDK